MNQVYDLVGESIFGEMWIALKIYIVHFDDDKEWCTSEADDSPNLLMIQQSWVTYMSVGEWQSYAYEERLEKDRMLLEK